MSPAGASTFVNYLRRTLGGDARATPDHALLERFVAERDEAAFEAVVRRHGPMVWGVCRRLLLHRQDAEDAFQATFLVLFRRAASIGRRELLANWLFGVARRVALNARGRRAGRARREKACGEWLAVVPAPEVVRDDGAAVLDEELARLPDRYRLPLLLCALEGHTHEEAGRCLGWPTGTVAGRLARGRALLRSRLLRRGVALTVGTFAAALPSSLVAAAVRGATAAAGPAVTALARGVLRHLFLSRLLATTKLVTALALALGAAGALLRPLSWEAGVAGPWPPAVSPVPGLKLVPIAGPTPPEVRLPADPSAVVLRLDRFGEPGSGLGTSLRVHADGRVVAELPEGVDSLVPTKLTAQAKKRGPSNAGHAAPRESVRVLEGKLDAEELQDLLRFAVFGQEVFAIDPAEVAAECQSARSASYGTDVLTTVLHVRTADQSHEVGWPLLRFHPLRVPEVKRLAQVHAVDLRLRNVFYVLLAGGPERVGEVVRLVNKHTRRHFPGAPHFTARDLTGVTTSASGVPTRYTFSRARRPFHNPEFAVWVELPPQSRPVFAFAPHWE